MGARWSVGAVLACGVVAGCNHGPATAPVSGRVTLDGNPLADYRVRLQPDADVANPGPISVGRTDADGRFTLRVLDRRGLGATGAVVGKARVSLSPFHDETADGRPIPPKVTLTSDELPFVVPAEGTDRADFDLSSKAARR